MIIMRYEIDAVEYECVSARVMRGILFDESYVLEGSLADEWGWLLEEETKSNQTFVNPMLKSNRYSWTYQWLS